MASVRLATPKDVPHIAAMIAQLAEFERLSDACIAKEEDYSATLFNAPPYQGPTVLLLELDSSSATYYQGTEIQDPDKEFFTGDDSKLVLGFVLFFPNYSTFLAKPGIYIEDLFIREPYRRQGFGSILLRRVAKDASDRGFGRVEWCVLDWNQNAINFYKQMGALVLDEWRICRLTGDALKSYGSASTHSRLKADDEPAS